MSYKTFSKFVALFCIGLSLSACQTTPKQPEGVVNQGQWGSRLRVKNLKKVSSHTVNVDVLARRSPAQVRMEVSAVMGIPVASMVMDQKEFASALYRQKRYYQGRVSDRALIPILQVPLSPAIFKNIIFDEPISGSDWSCQKGIQGLVESCQSNSLNLSVNWERRETGKIVRIRHPDFEADWAFQIPSTEVQFKDETFKLSAPSGFTVIRL